MRVRMRRPSKSPYAPPYEIGKVIYSDGIGVVVRSEDPNVKVGSHGPMYTASWPLFSEHKHYRILYNLKCSAFNVHWCSGRARPDCLHGVERVLRRQERRNILRVGTGWLSWLARYPTRQNGRSRVVVSAGSAEKVQFIKKIGTGVAFNYKNTKTADVLEREGPIDIYWDNVGGGTLEAAIDAAAVGARFIVCFQMKFYVLKLDGLYL